MDYSTSCKYSLRLTEKLKSLDIQNVLDFELINKAIYFARKYHGDQKRKSGELYYTHPLEVAYMISDYNLKTDVIVASILHDTVEDTEVSVEMIQGTFGERIAEMVDRLSRDRPDGTKLTVEEVLNNSYKVKEREVLLIKLFDRLHNMQTLGCILPEKAKKVTEETLNFFIITAMYMGYKDLEKVIYELCCNNLSIDSSFDKDFQFSECKSYLDSLEVSHSHQTVSQVFQNVINQVKNRK
ncbi:guanosine polyphosphate pyrophosphohydrolase [Candidatus Megaera polyxenophila]|nr:guanosine polyphosphate pyrophosphohydrolase [Candidatus Megaera polyxenophila]BBB57328.1 guanosine polyphosphate pyrophosphohydrolase [Candidatus Megaera polyxenophila]